MRPLETRQRFRAQLDKLHLAPDDLDPWSGWRAFKEFLKQEVEGLYDAASIQIRPEDDGTSLFFVRQFTEREDASGDAEDELVGRLADASLVRNEGLCLGVLLGAIIHEQPR